jgi:hypothetical protein
MAGGTLFVDPYFMFGMPAGWSAAPGGDPGLYTFSGPGVQAMALQTASTILTLEEVTAGIALVIKSKGAGDPEKTEAIAMGGAAAKLLTYHYSLMGLNVYQLEAICVHSGRAHELSFGNVAGTESADRALFLAVLASFAFLGAGY